MSSTEISNTDYHSRLGVSLAALSSRKTLIEPALRTVKRYVTDDDLKFVATNFIMLQVSAFLDEWRLFQTFAQNDRAVRRTTLIAKPAIDRIKLWGGIRTFRNSMIAHARRNDTAKPLLTGEISDFPSQYAEQLLLGECAVYAIAVAAIRHDHISKTFLEHHPSGPILAGGGIQSKGEFICEILSIRSTILQIEPELEEKFGEFNPWP